MSVSTICQRAEVVSRRDVTRIGEAIPAAVTESPVADDDPATTGGAGTVVVAPAVGETGDGEDYRYLNQLIYCGHNDGYGMTNCSGSGCTPLAPASATAANSTVETRHIYVVKRIGETPAEYEARSALANGVVPESLLETSTPGALIPC